MGKIELPQILALVSMVLGLSCLITSSLLLDVYVWIFKDVCDSIVAIPLICEPYEYVLAAGSFGVIAAVAQIGAAYLGYAKKWKVWCILHLVIALVSLVAFSIAIDKGVHDGRTGGKKDPVGRGKAFVAFAGIDLFFSFGAAAGVFYLTKE